MSSRTPLLSSRTPLLSSRTPLLSSRTPLLSSRTPLLSSWTPLLSSRTPIRDPCLLMVLPAAWIADQVRNDKLAVSSRTPLLSSRTPLLSSRTPLLSSRTPIRDPCLLMVLPEAWIADQVRNDKLALSSRTPLLSSRTPLLSSRTPLLSSRTPIRDPCLLTVPPAAWIADQDAMDASLPRGKHESVERQEHEQPSFRKRLRVIEVDPLMDTASKCPGRDRPRSSLTP